jgi:superfamily II RNA helicase
MVVHCKDTFHDHNLEYQEYFNQFPYPLSDFQKWSIFAIVNGHHSLVTAHTGSGKTLPAEFAIEYFKKKGKKVIYTGPIKALCNQKLYDFKKKFPNISFGILTGDVKDNPEADVLIMTTEILRNTLFNKKINTKNTESKPIELQFDLDIETELGAVVFDEVHYIGDADRGSVWEQSILLLPPKVQLIMLSATIEKPQIFAEWLETEKNKGLELSEKKQLYMTTTYERVVPLTHYLWTSCAPSVIQSHKGTPMEYKLREVINKPLQVASSGGTFNDANYYKTSKILDYFFKNKITSKRQYILNDLVQYLNRNDMLPALCFIFSRKNVEIAAKEITHTLFDKDDKTPNIIEHECEKILMSKLKNYREYTMLDEYQSIVTLLKKGIAIHHAGIMPILREMVELLFEKRYIKLLFATETFAVGINMPTKTVIFTQLSKFSGNGMRELMSHEYTQMAGRAGRRGIDKIGHVIHCNNLFRMPEFNTYKAMLTGPPKMLISQFKISFNLILSIISAQGHSLAHQIDNELINFMEKSFVQNDITKEINMYDKLDKELQDKLNLCEETLNSSDICKTSKDILKKYHELTNNIKVVNNKQKKRLQREICEIEEQNKTIKKDIEYIIEYESILDEKKKNGGFKMNAVNYIQNNIDNIIHILNINNFLEYGYGLTSKGIVAMHIQELHPLVLGDMYEKYNGFTDFSAKELTGVLSCFTNISIPQDMRLSVPGDIHINSRVKNCCKNIGTLIEKYYDIEVEYQLDTGAEYDIHYELIDYVIKWCDCDDEKKCILLINELKTTKEVFLGEFIKAILKINNIAKELEKICELNENISLLQKVKEISELTLKYVVTNQSLYI